MRYITRVLVLGVLAISLVVSGTAEAAQYVNGYYRSNGTYVNGYYRSSPDSSPYNNYSYPGNTNPYTGKTAGGSTSTYLKNYYGSSGSYLGNSISGSSYLPSYTSGYTTPTYGSSAYSYSEPKPSRKIARSISWMAKSWSDKNPDSNCPQAPLTKKDKKACSNYRKTSDNDSYSWTISKNQDKSYKTCDQETYYYLNACEANEKLVCSGTVASCQLK